MQVLIIDNYDSFTYNLVHVVEQYVQEVVVLRNNVVRNEDVDNADAVIISPGPGLPKDAGKTCEVIEQFAGKKPILGVCLGLQAIGEVFGAELKNLNRVYHGKQMPVKVVDSEEVLFKDIENTFDVGRYHSWVIDGDSLPKCLNVTAVDECGEIMAVTHEKLNVKGVQFHPESVMTKVGNVIIRNWVRYCIKQKASK